MAKKVIYLTQEDLLRLWAATQVMIQKLKNDVVEEQEIKPFKDLYASLYMNSKFENREFENEYAMEFMEDEEDEEEEESLEFGEGEHDFRHK